MKHLLTLILCAICTLLHGQVIELEEKPGQPDSVRFRYDYVSPDGFELTVFSAYDTLPDALAFGLDLYLNGGFIRNLPVPRMNQYYTDEVITFIKENSFYFSEERESLAETLGDVLGFDPMIQDSTLNYDMIGTWVVNGYYCGMSADTVVVDMQDNGFGTRRMYVTPQGGTRQGMLQWADGIIGVRDNNVIIKQAIPLIRVGSNTRQGFGGCFWTKIPD